MEASNYPLLLFAKAPIAGKVKTRLMSHCTAEQAALIAKILMEATIKSAREHWRGDVMLSVWQGQASQEEHNFINDLCERYGVALHQQSDGDLGEKMAAAFRDVAVPAAILGCDVPLIPKQTFLDVYQCLQNQQSAIVPSEDGGYCMIALAQSMPELFENVAWGSDAVFAQTQAIIERINADIKIMPASFDVDDWQDVQRAANHLPALQQFIADQRL